METTNVRLSDFYQSPKPSFPAKRRVRVPQCILYETPTRPEKVSNVKNQSDKFEVVRNANASIECKSQKNDSTSMKEKPAFDDKGDPVFKPFFWLRERDDNSDEETSEDLSTQQKDDRSTGNPPCNAPCFSDIKDSADWSPIKMTPTGDVSSKSKAADAFDSEMFEWTQRACSPELCLTPVKQQEECETAAEFDTAFRNKTVVSKRLKSLNEEQENENMKMESPLLSSKQSKSRSETAAEFDTAFRNKTVVSKRLKSLNEEQENENMKMESPLLSSKQSKSRSAKNKKKKAITKRKRPNSKVQSKGAKSSKSVTVSDELAREVPTSPIEVAEVFNQGNKCTENEKEASSERKLSKQYERGKPIELEVSMNWTSGTSADEELQERPKKSSEVKLLNQGKEKVEMMESPVLSQQQNENDKSLGEEIKIGKLKIRKCARQFKKLNTDKSMARALKQIPKDHNRRMENQENTNLNKELPVLPCPRAENDRSMESGKRTRDRVQKINTQYKRNNTREPKEPKRLKNCSGNVTEHEAIDEVLLDTNRSDGKENKHQEELVFEWNGNSAKDKVLPTAKDHSLQKCENVPNKILCAFCQSGNDSEASGVMLHYFDGKPVSADYNRGFNVIHSHSNCTEWAPNVYFEDDTAINLEAEIARSKRIKCSCCGVKGASLGCYEKSCRKSFHVPCAKLVPECRWDPENFVILCPLHSSSKLPKEIIGSQLKRRNKSAPKMDLQAHAAVHPGLQRSGNWKWHSALPSKWVICCSALTAAEKEIVLNFTRMVGVSISKTWNPTVTHVIASTDENGACKRTLKFLMGILEGKWILKLEWIKACMAAMEPVSEEQFEISTDVHGINNGPRFGRLRVMNKEPKLLNGLTFYFVGDFVPTYKGYLQNLVSAGGGIVLQRKPISRDQARLLNESFASKNFIIYSLELPERCDSSKKDIIINRRRAEAEALANATGAKVAAHSWILDSIAACKL
ncbi:hypothetical protein MRB53_020560 [Persea americana]|uniref:Uncharacterized protein n=1 Tax=Persea americana TaxID=3435 RepID=A0ACC2L2M5_PERAE|nr:hypothetical protein MRB53_020560 [Persea americana]